MAVYPELNTAYEAQLSLPKEARDACAAVATGDQPFSDLPADCRKALDRERRAVLQVLRATHAARLELPPGFSALHAASWTAGAPNFGPLQYAAKLAALDIRGRLAGQIPVEDRTVSPISECVDALALSRDVSQSKGLIGSMIGVAIVRTLTASCAAALDTTPPIEKRSAAAKILEIRDATRTFRDVLRDESVFAQAGFARLVLSASELDDLPTDASALARAFPVDQLGFPFWYRPFVAGAWRRTRTNFERCYAAMDLPRASRALALTQIHDDDARGWGRLGTEPFEDFAKFYTRYLRGLELLELLVAAATADALRAETGRWPTREEILSARGGLEESTFTLTSKGDSLELALADDGKGAVKITMTPDR